MVRKLLKTKDNKQQIKFILMVSSKSWPLGRKISLSRTCFYTERQNFDLLDVIGASGSSGSKNI